MRFLKRATLRFLQTPAVHNSTVGNGPANVIDGNVIWNTNDFAIQSAAESIIRNNIILGESIGLQPHQAGRPSNQQIFHNTIVTDGDGIEVRGVSGTVAHVNPTAESIARQWRYLRLDSRIC